MDYVLIYLLSTRLFHMVEGLSVVTLIGLAVAVILTTIASMGERDDSREVITAKTVRSAAKKIAVIAAICLTVCSLVPSRKGLIQAYLIVEGTKIVNAENADKALEVFNKKIDKLIEVLDEAD
jgi:hypothetical protein